MATKSNKKRYGTHVTTHTGKRVYLSGGSRKELADKVAQARVELGVGVDISDATTFRQYAETWRKAYKVGKIRANSLATLDTNLYSHVIPFFGDRKLRDIKPLDIQLFLGSISQYSKSTQDKCFQIVRGILRSAAENGLLLRSPVTSNDKTGGATAEEEEPLTPAQCRALLAATHGTRAYLFCLLALTCGLRRSEILGLMWEDVDLQAGKLTVRHTKVFPGKANDAPVLEMTKSDASQRVLPLPAIAAAALVEEKARSKSPYVLSMRDGSSLTRSSYRGLWATVERRTATADRSVGEQFGTCKGGTITVSLDFDCHPHQLRHTCITNWFEQGLDIKQVQYLAGHSTPTMTLKIYTHYRQKVRDQETIHQVRKAADYLGEA